jgi:hypothetical protein
VNLLEEIEALRTAAYALKDSGASFEEARIMLVCQKRITMGHATDLVIMMERLAKIELPR